MFQAVVQKLRTSVDSVSLKRSDSYSTAATKALATGCVCYAGYRLLSAALLKSYPIRTLQGIDYAPLSETDAAVYSVSRGYIYCTEGRTYVEDYRYSHASDEIGTDSRKQLTAVVCGFANHSVWDSVVDAMLHKWRAHAAEHKDTDASDALTTTVAIDRVLVYHLFGRGLSDACQRQNDLGLFVEQLSQVTDTCNVFDSAKHKGIVLCGVSMGGLIAAKWASLNPHKVCKLLSVSPAGLSPIKRSAALKLAICPLVGDLLMPITIPRLLLDNIDARYYITEDPVETQRAKVISKVGIAMKRVLENHCGLAPSLVSTFRCVFSKQSYAAVYDECAEALTAEKWMVVWGKDDGLCPFQGCEYLRSKGVLAIELDECDHGDIVAEYKVRQWFDCFWNWV